MRASTPATDPEAVGTQLAYLLQPELVARLDDLAGQRLARCAMSARLKIVHNCPNAAALNVLIDQDLVGVNIVFRQSTEYREFAPGSHDLTFTQVGAREPLLGPLSLMLTDHESYTLSIDCPRDTQARLSVELRRDIWVRPSM